MPLRLAFIGFRHGHIMALYKAAKGHAEVQIVAACEDHGPTADSLRSAGVVALTHGDYHQMLAQVDCDAVAIGDYFAHRGQVIIDSLNAGKHVISDKPICTRMEELGRIEKLLAQKQRRLGCLLDLRDSGALRTMRRLISENAIGPVHTVIFTAQHPLFLATRPSWYFEEGKHGGTLNDIAIHAVDAIAWMTGRRLVEVTAARAWNARLPQFPHFQDAAQCLLRMDNNGSAFGDVSYLAPDGTGYAAPQYWRITCHGSDGVVEGNLGGRTIQLIGKADKSVRSIDADADVPTGRIDEFLADISGRPAPGALATAAVLDASRRTLLIQQCADQRRAFVSLDA